MPEQLFDTLIDYFILVHFIYLIILITRRAAKCNFFVHTMKIRPTSVQNYFSTESPQVHRSTTVASNE